MKNIAVVAVSEHMKCYMDNYLRDHYADTTIDLKVVCDVIRNVTGIISVVFDEILFERYALGDDEDEGGILETLSSMDKEIKEAYPDHWVNIVVPLDLTGRVVYILTDLTSE